MNDGAKGSRPVNRSRVVSRRVVSELGVASGFAGADYLISPGHRGPVVRVSWAMVSQGIGEWQPRCKLARRARLGVALTVPWP